MSLEVKLQVFEGPLDLLLHLIDKNQIDIYDMPIVTITEQYMAYINAMQKQDMDVTSEFLVMASTLLHLKSRRLLPQKEKETEEISEEELIRRLSEYKRYKELAPALSDRLNEYKGSFYKMQPFPKEPERLYYPNII